MSQSFPGTDDAFLQEVVAATGEGILTLDTHGTVVFANPHVEDLLGYERGELVGRPIGDIVPMDQEALFEQLERRVDETGPTSRTRKLVFGHEDGSDVPVALTVEQTEYEGDRYYTVTLQSFSTVEEQRRRLVEECNRRITLFENANDPIVEFVFDETSPVITAVNDAFEDVFGYSPDDVVGKDAADLLVPDEEYEGHRRIVDSLFRDDRVDAEVRRQTVSGPREFLLRAVRFGGGETGGYAIYTDITEQQRREKEIRETKERLQTVFEHANDAIFIFDPRADEFVDCNPRACEMLGYTREELLALSPSAVHPDEMEDFVAFIDGVMEAGGGWTDELTCRTCDGGRLPAEISASRIDIDGRTHVLALARDLSARRDREREVCQRSTAMEATSDGMAILDEDGNYVYVNRALATIHGYDDTDELVGDTWHHLYGEAERRRLETEIIPTVRSEGEWRGEVTGRCRNGTTVPQELTMTALDGGGLVYAARDITERKTHVQKLEAIDEAGRALMAADSFDAIARQALDAVDTVLGFDVGCVRLFDDASNGLDVATMTDAARTLVESCPAFDLDASVAGRAFRRQETVVSPLDEADLCEGMDASASMHLSLDDYGTLTVFTRSPDGFEELEIHHAELLAASVGVALETAEREQTLYDNERELRRQHAELDTLNQINALIQELIQGLVDTSTREEIFQTVCDRLAASDFYESAWVGSVDTADGRLTSLAGTGVDDDYLDALETMPLPHLEHGSVAKAVKTGALQVVRQYQVDGPEVDADDADVPRQTSVEAVAAIPLAYGERTYAVLVVNASREDVFSDAAQAGFAALGDAVGFAINATLNRELLRSDTVVELEFEVTADHCLPVGLSRTLGGRCRLAKASQIEDGRFLCFFRVEGAVVDDAQGLADELAGVEDSRVVSGDDESFMLELTVTDSTVVQVLMEVGANVTLVDAVDGRARVVAEVPHGADVRSVVEPLQDRYPGSSLASKRELDRPVRTAAEIRRQLTDRLTEKQLIALQTAYASGYYDWPRRNNAAELATSLGVSAPTLHQHLRKAECKLVETFLDDSPDHLE
ncbi:PAS domain S-box protein [Halobacteriaceae archaeon GCM10025711]